LRDHLQTAAKMPGIADFARRELAGPRPPEELGYLWRWFIDLSAARVVGEQGMQPIAYAEIFAWSELGQIRPRPWEVDVLRQLDAVWIVKSKEAGDAGSGEAQPAGARARAGSLPG
jgi:hypothetical protein